MAISSLSQSHSPFMYDFVPPASLPHCSAPASQGQIARFICGKGLGASKQDHFIEDE
jgi:hypothetical protein